MILLIVALFVVSCSEVNDEPTGETLVSGTIEFTDDEQGYSFSSGELSHFGSSWAGEGSLLNEIDIAWGDYHLATPKFIDGNIIDQRIIHLGIIDYDSLKSFSEDDWKWSYGPDWDDDIPGWAFHQEGFLDHVFLLKTHANTFAKLKVIEIDWSNHSIIVQYLLQNDGSKVFE